MSDRLPGALTISLTLHVAVAGLMLLLTYAANQSREDTTKVFELIAGPGDNFGATVAAKLGEPGGIKVDIPEPKPQPEAPKPEMVAEPAPVQVQPVPEVKPKPEPKLANISKQIERKIVRAEDRGKAAVAKEKADEAKRMTKAEYDAKNKKPATQTPAGPPKVAKVDGEGIRKGVVGGSAENKTGGAGGKALVREDGPVMEAYYAMLTQRLRTSLLEKAAGLSDSLVTVVQLRIGADGTLSGAHVTKSSGSEEFDSAVLAAIAATRMPARPDGKSEVLTIPFRMKEQDAG